MTWRVGVLDQGLLDHRLSLRVGRLERLAGPALEMAHRAERDRDPEEVMQGRALPDASGGSAR